MRDITLFGFLNVYYVTIISLYIFLGVHVQKNLFLTLW